MLHGWHSNSGIHGYLDREGRGGKMAIHGCSMDDTVTLASTDRQRGKGRQGGHPWMLHGWHSNYSIHGYLDRVGGGGGGGGVRQGGHPWMLHG